MQLEPTETSNLESLTNRSQPSTSAPSQHGFHCSQSVSPDSSSATRSPLFVDTASTATPRSHGPAALDFGRLSQELGRLSVADDGRAYNSVDLRFAAANANAISVSAGRRISEYEKATSASASRHSPRPPLGFKVTKRPGSPSDGVQLTDFPNEILTHVLSHLHPDSHGAVALVSKRFYALVTTPYAWRTAFMRYFPGQDVLDTSQRAIRSAQHDGSSDEIRSESRYFTRLTPLASWRSEYLLRTRLLRSVARGKPGSIGSSIRSSQMGKKASAVLTYNSKLPWTITHIHAAFVAGKKGPRVIHGADDLCVASVSDPMVGKVEKWGLDDPFSFAQLDEMFPNLEPYGVGDGPAAVPNIMDVSQPYGIVGGEGFPGGRVYFRAAGELRGRYLSPDSTIIDMMPEIPKIPELSEAICSVWVAKSSSVPAMTHSMFGILTGSSLGVVTSYAVRHDSTGPRYSNGDMTARWVLSPGVPIVDIKVDDSYNPKRKVLNRVWAVALNALGEVYYLTETPTPPLARGKAENATKDAWYAGRTVYWKLIEPTRRQARHDEFDRYATRGAYSPRSPANSMNLSKEQIMAEAKEIEKFLRHKPAHFRNACQGWDMRRKIEVDFAGGDENSSGEAVFVITCGHEKGECASVCRYIRGASVTQPSTPTRFLTPSVQPKTTSPSIFGGTGAPDAPEITGGTSDSSKPTTPQLGPVSQGLNAEEWRATEFSLENHGGTEIMTTAVDICTFAIMASFEDPLLLASQEATPETPKRAASKLSAGEIPGRRSRALAIGTNTGSVIIWNMRDTTLVAKPMRVIQTDSPSISCLAVSALYLVHGGSDGLVQAWDPLASSLEPVRTLNAKSSGRIPRHILNANPALQNANYTAVGAIFLDPDPTVLRGVLSFGTFLRFWTYSSTGQSPGRKRRVRHSDIHGRLATRRHGGVVSSYIAAEEAELRQEQEHRSRELGRLRKRFGVGLGDLTEEEAIRYAELISEESFLDEQRRLSASDTGSAADIGDTASSTGSVDTVTSEPSLSGASPSTLSLPPLQEETDDDYEAQIQRAIRLSLLEGVNDAEQSPPNRSSGDYEFHVKVKSKDKKKGKRSSSTSPSTASTPAMQYEGSSQNVGVDADGDLALALRLSLEEESARQTEAAGASAASAGFDDYPPLEVDVKGKRKWA
ncbi:hypothetical protein B0T24DRAFT_569256 [Lasiosphaeria ovina]|uniref:F-box domain-containing protein n=1 Tax=Lasiosphaeria ovina TaxID=92902 RepID=A0AAE0KMB6_9PEZI|nr:hypothetical protein B0T24DRAFT_569256 [Lasiosphaeria ovina]